MSVLNAEHLSHGFGNRTIFQDVPFRLLKGEHVGLVGANGEGKSTFMNITTDKLMPDEDKVEWVRDVRVGYLDQYTVLEKGTSIRDMLKSAFTYLFGTEEKMNHTYDHVGEAFEEGMNQVTEELRTIQDLLITHDFYIINPKVGEMGRALSLDEIDLDKDVMDLDGGQRMKVLLGELLLGKPGILFLDEPTNYLDVWHIRWLKRYFQEYKSAFTLISHGIPFLNSVVNLIYHMKNRRFDRYVGGYDKFQGVYTVKRAQLGAIYECQQQEITKLEDFVVRNKVRVSTRNMAMSKQKKLDKMDVVELAREKPKPKFHFMEVRAAGKYVFETHDLVTGYDKPLSHPLNLAMERGEKIVLKSANDTGKATLLRSILRLTPALEGSVELGDYLYIGYFGQGVAPGNTTTCIEGIWREFPSYTQYQVRSAPIKCGFTTRHIESQVHVPSDGEQAKVRLCKLINRETNVLLLDEPTNHLDVEAKEELRHALQVYKGSILLIYHESEFYEELATKMWNCSEWSLKI